MIDWGKGEAILQDAIGSEMRERHELVKMLKKACAQVANVKRSAAKQEEMRS